MVVPFFMGKSDGTILATALLSMLLAFGETPASPGVLVSR